MVTMRRFLIACFVLLVIYIAGYNLYYYTGFHFGRLLPEIKTMTKTDEDTVYLFLDGEYREFEIKGVNMGAGVPGHFATDFSITKEQYLRWFQNIKDMGANTIRVYTLLAPAFYDAVYEYNSGNADPIYIIHGLWLDDYVHFSHRDAYDDDILGALERDSRTMIDVLWGNRNVYLGTGEGTGFYRSNISEWVLGYILGVEWEDLTVVYTDHKYAGEKDSYQGKYMYTTKDASPFEAMLARLGDGVIDYESKRYGAQRLIAFSNWPTTDPFEYNHAITYFFNKVAKVDVEHIKTTEKFISGTFASYHVYPYYPDYLSYEEGVSQRLDINGNVNTYYAYLQMLNDYHTMPVVISEYGAPSSRGMTQIDKHTGRNQGGISEHEQAEALVECYNDIKNAGCAGSIVFSWQDEWFKRTWNTMANIDLMNTAYWSDYQTNEQYFGLLSFDPGKQKSVCYVDGDIAEWDQIKPLAQNDELTLSMVYDEKFIYFMVESPGLTDGDDLYLPIDTIPKSGAVYCENYSLGFDRGVDFVIRINGADNSSVVVQERYEVLRATQGESVLGINPYVIPPEKDTTKFNPINMILRMTVLMDKNDVANLTPKEFSTLEPILAEVHETGKLVVGNANPYTEGYNSLADFCYGNGCVEIKLPWQLLNFSNPNEMKIHDDYYEHYGVESIRISEMYVGAAINPKAKDEVNTTKFLLQPWEQDVEYHERLKPAYYALQQIWTQEEGTQ